MPKAVPAAGQPKAGPAELIAMFGELVQGWPWPCIHGGLGESWIIILALAIIWMVRLLRSVAYPGHDLRSSHGQVHLKEP